MQRRDFLWVGTAVGAVGLSGCAGMFETESARSREQFTTVADREEQVYYPTHMEGAKMVGMGGEGRLQVGLMYSFPHAFWTITGTDTNLVEVGDDATAHLMATIWDADTETVLPTANVSVELSKDGETVDSRSLWPMLSQNMGYHFGDNVILDGDGTYTASLDVGEMQARGIDELAGTFDGRTTLEVEFEHKREFIGELAYEQLPDKQGDSGALKPMDMKMPVSQEPAHDALSGTVIGTAASGDADFVIFLPEETPEGIDGKYLAVSPRTPYNRYPLPFMGLSMVLTQDGETVFDDALNPAVSPEYGYHYGAGIEGVESDDSLTLTIDTPPQVARHEGYETAFIEMSEIELTV